jgi:hypothetical protein
MEKVYNFILQYLLYLIYFGIIRIILTIKKVIGYN